MRRPPQDVTCDGGPDPRRDDYREADQHQLKVAQPPIMFTVAPRAKAGVCYVVHSRSYL